MKREGNVFVATRDRRRARSGQKRKKPGTHLLLGHLLAVAACVCTRSGGRSGVRVVAAWSPVAFTTGSKASARLVELVFLEGRQLFTVRSLSEENSNKYLDHMNFEANKA
jgi:hypothetical protein